MAGKKLSAGTRLVRQNLFDIIGLEGSAADPKLDAYIQAQRSNDFYAPDFNAPPPPRVQGVDTLALSKKQRAEIADGNLIVVGSRKERRRPDSRRSSRPGPSPHFALPVVALARSIFFSVTSW